MNQSVVIDPDTLISMNSQHVCKECYEAYTEFVKSRKKD